MPDTVVLTGSSGYAGRVLAAAILTRGTERLVLPIRSGRSAAEVAEAILEEAQACAPDRPVASYADRLELVPFDGLRDRLGRSAVREIIHCAGCVDYFDKDKLTAGNLVLTHDMLKLGRALGVERFVYLSTAFSAGDRNGALIKEELHTDDDGADLTDYMASKRQAELMVANSGLAFLILRPPVMIGDSRTGRYSGKPYGLVQFWEGWARIILSTYRDEQYFVVPSGAVPPLLHQDAFQESVLYARAHLPDDSIIHLVPASQNTLSVRELYLAPLHRARPRTVYFYEQLDDVPKQALYPAARMFLEICAVNIEISGRDWRFQRGRMEELEAQGLVSPRVSAASVGACFDYFAARSPAMQKYFQRYGASLPPEIEVIDAPRQAALAGA